MKPGIPCMGLQSLHGDCETSCGTVFRWNRRRGNSRRDVAVLNDSGGLLTLRRRNSTCRGRDAAG